MLPHWHKTQNWKYVSYVKISIPNWTVLYTYIHLIKCFPLKSYIWPHIGLGRSWRRFLFLSKLVMSPDNSRKEAPFSSWGGRRRRRCDPAPPHGLREITDSLNITIKRSSMNLLRNTIVSGQKGRVLVRSISAPPPWSCVPSVVLCQELCDPRARSSAASRCQASARGEAQSHFQYWFAEH